MRGIGRGVMVAGAVAVLLGGAFDGVAEAKRQKFVANVGGKVLKIPSRAVLASQSPAGILVAGVKVSLAGRSTTTRNITFGCEVPGLAAGMSLPVTVGCGGAYGIVSLSGGKGWTTETNGISLTIKSFNGTRLVGTFSGQFETPGDTNPGDPPVAVQNGKLSVDLLGG